MALNSEGSKSKALLIYEYLIYFKKEQAMEETSNLKEHLEQIDNRIDELKNAIELGKDLESLHEDERFKRVILSGYLEDEAQRLFGVLVTPSTLKRDVVQNIQDKLSAIRNLKQFFGVILQNAHMAPMQIEEEEDYRKEVTEHYSNDKSDKE
jgi:sulfur transfer protein SufE